MAKSMLAVCMLVATVYLSVVLSASINDERILDNNLNSNKFGLNGIFGKKGSTRNPTNLTCPSNPVCNLTSIRCKRDSDCYPAMPVCCAGSTGNSTVGIRCCSPASTQAGPSTCPGNNPPPACRSADVCNSNAECFDGERCCRTYFGGVLLNNSCCVSATRGAQCPTGVVPGTCILQNQICGGNADCGAGQVCCAINDNPALRCCVFSTCPATITGLNQCVGAGGANGVEVCEPGSCIAGQICCHPGTSTFPCCVDDPSAG